MAAAPGPGLEAVTEVVLLAPALETSVEALKLGPADAALAALARLTAQLIDRAQNPPLALSRLGPLLCKLLVALDARKVRPQEPQRPNRVAELRGRRVAEDARRRR